MATQPTPNVLVGLPWQLAEAILQAASIPYKVVFGKNFEAHFSISETGAYVGRVQLGLEPDAAWQILLYKPMVDSAFRECQEVQYAEDIQKLGKNRA